MAEPSLFQSQRWALALRARLRVSVIRRSTKNMWMRFIGTSLVSLRQPQPGICNGPAKSIAPINLPNRPIYCDLRPAEENRTGGRLAILPVCTKWCPAALRSGVIGSSPKALGMKMGLRGSRHGGRK